MTEWLLAQLFDRVRTAMGVRNCADGCHLLQVLVACRLCHICYDLAQRVDVGFRFCRFLHYCLLSHSLQRRSSVHGSVFELRQGLAPDRSGGGTSSVSNTFEDSEALFIFTYSLIANKSSIVTSLCTMLWCKPSATPYVVTKVMTKESFVLVELWNSSIRCRNSCS